MRGEITEGEVERILTPCRRFGGKHELKPDVAVAVVSAIVKGKNLIRTALEWKVPVVGGNGTRYDRLRGTQWRLVLAWTGIETIVAATRHSGRLRRSDLSAFLDGCGLPEFPVLEPPRRSLKSLEHWLDAGRGDELHPICAYLGLTGDEVLGSIKDWLIEGRAVDTWTSAMLLAKAFRHTSAHGALSANKIKDWGLSPAFDHLVVRIGCVGTHALRQLAEP